MNIVINKHGNSFVTLKMCPECSSFHLEYHGVRSEMEIVGRGLWVFHQVACNTMSAKSKKCAPDD